MFDCTISIFTTYLIIGIYFLFFQFPYLIDKVFYVFQIVLQTALLETMQYIDI